MHETKEDKEMGKKNEAARMLANLRPGAQRRVLMVLEQCFDDVSVEDAEKAGYANTEG